MQTRIKMIRKESGLNQKDFGSRIGVNQSTIAGYENGIRTPIEAIINSMCKEFGVNEEWLRYGTGVPYVEKSDEELIAKFFGEVEALDEDSFTKRFIKMLASMSAEQRGLFEEMGQMLLDQAKKDE